MDFNFNQVSQKAGIIYRTGQRTAPLTERVKRQIAMDSASNLVTTPNGGIPSLFTTYIDPKVIEVIVKPMKMAEAFMEVKKGDFTSSSVMFAMIEGTGEVSTYGDFNSNGLSGANTEFIYRQPYHYQTNIRVGEREMEIMSQGDIDIASRKQISAALALNKFQNKSYAYGIEGLQNYGMLNDPDLLPSLVEDSWEKKDGQAVYDSIQRLFVQLVKQTNGLVDRDTPMKLVLSPGMESAFTRTNSFNVNVSDQLKKNFPNLTTTTVPEYETNAGQLLQLVVEEFQGQRTVELGFTEKMRVHNLIQMTSGYEQKRSQGTCGAVIYVPLFIASLLCSK